MKGKQFYVLLIGLLLVGFGSIFLYRKQEEQRVLEFEGYEVSVIEDRVDALYNAEKTDIVQDISEEELETLETIFEELEQKKLSRRSRNQIQDLQLEFLSAQSMLETEAAVEAIFVESNVVDKEVSEEMIDALEYDVLAFEKMPDYINRNIERLAYARQQVVEIDRASEFIDRLFDEEGNVLETVSREDEEEARELIEAIQNEEVKEELSARIETVRLVLTEREEQLALEQEREAAEEVEETEDYQTPQAPEEAAEEEEDAIEETQEPQYTAPPAQPWNPPANSKTGSGTSGGSGSGGSGSFDSSNQTEPQTPSTPADSEPDSESSSKPEEEPAAAPDPEPEENPEDENPEGENSDEEPEENEE